MKPTLLPQLRLLDWKNQRQVSIALLGVLAPLWLLLPLLPRSIETILAGALDLKGIGQTCWQALSFISLWRRRVSRSSGWLSGCWSIPKSFFKKGKTPSLQPCVVRDGEAKQGGNQPREI